MFEVGALSAMKLQGVKADGTKYFWYTFAAQVLQLDRLKLQNISTSVEEGLGDIKQLNGFLGDSILENFVVTVDYSQKQLVLAGSSNQCDKKNSIILPMILRDRRPYCNVKLNGKLERLALLDSGAPVSMAADSLLKPILSQKLYFKDRITGPWLGTLDSTKARLNSLLLGSFNFKNLNIHVFSAQKAPVVASYITLGSDYLRRFKSVTFDFLSRRVIFEL
jgi:hypothetical protein